MQSPILGQAYVARSVNAAANRLVNLYPEIIPEDVLGTAFLQRAPGLRLLATVGNGPIRGLWQFGGYGYVVSGNELYKLNSLFVPTLLGTVTGSGPVSMADNGFQLFVACNPDGFIYNSVTNVLTQITDPDFPGVVTVGYLDGYFVFNEPNSQKIWVTTLLDGMVIDPLDFASAEGSPDNIQGVIISNRECWVIGTGTTEVWYDAGTADFPLLRLQGAFNEVGGMSPYSICKLDNSVFWLGQDSLGNGVVYRSNGYNAERVSTHSIEWHIQSYSNLSDAIAYAYQQDGHSFYVLTFPTDSKTWVYDVNTDSWHERASWVNGFIRHRSNCHMFFASENCVGDFENGKIYAFDLEVYSDNGDIQPWLRSWSALPPEAKDYKRTTQHSLQLNCESGVGLVSGQGSDPVVSLRWSDDGGHTWSNYHSRSMGKIGEFFKRVIWHRLGMTLKLRDRVYEVSGSDQVKIEITGAELIVSGTNA